MNEIIVGSANSLANLQPVAISPQGVNESVSPGLLSGVANIAELLGGFSIALGPLGCDRRATLPSSHGRDC